MNILEIEINGTQANIFKRSGLEISNAEINAAAAEITEKIINAYPLTIANRNDQREVKIRTVCSKEEKFKMVKYAIEVLFKKENTNEAQI